MRITKPFVVSEETLQILIKFRSMYESEGVKVGGLGRIIDSWAAEKRALIQKHEQKHLVGDSAGGRDSDTNSVGASEPKE